MSPLVARVLHCRSEIAGWQAQEKAALEKLSDDEKKELAAASSQDKPRRASTSGD